MYSKKAWGGSKDPAITIKFPKSDNDADTVSLVIFEYEDEKDLGLYPDEEREDVCVPMTIGVELKLVLTWMLTS